MKVEVDEFGNIILKEVFNGIGLKTQEGNFLGICMRDDTFEINIRSKDSIQDNWFRVDLQTLTINRL